MKKSHISAYLFYKMMTFDRRLVAPVPSGIIVEPAGRAMTSVDDLLVRTDAKCTAGLGSPIGYMFLDFRLGPLQWPAEP